MMVIKTKAITMQIIDLWKYFPLNFDSMLMSILIIKTK